MVMAAAYSCGSTVPLVNPSATTSVLATYSSENNAANKVLSPALQSKDEAGTSAAIDNEYYKVTAAEGASAPPYAAFTLTQLAASVPKQTNYPIGMLVETKASGSGTSGGANSQCNGLFVFLKGSSGAGWHDVLEPEVPAASRPALETSSGWGSQQGSATPVVTPANLPGAAAQAMEQGEQTGSYGSHFSQSMITSNAQSCSAFINNYSSDAHLPPTLHITNTVEQYAPDDTAAFGMKNGATLVIFSLVYRWNLTAPAGEGLPVSPSKSAPWTLLISPGAYSTLTVTTDVQMVAIDNSSSQGGWQAISAYSGITSVTGKRLSGGGVTIPTPSTQPSPSSSSITV